MLDPKPITDLVGVVLLAAVIAWQYVGMKRAAKA